MSVEVLAGTRTATYSFSPEHSRSVLAFYDNLLDKGEISSYKAKLDNGETIWRVAA